MLSLFSDNVPAVNIGSWPLEVSMFDGDLMAGPVVSLFAEDIEEARRNVTSNPQRAHGDLQRVMRAFFMPETILPEDAQAIIKKPR
jgi:hypothetical protein